MLLNSLDKYIFLLREHLWVKDVIATWLGIVKSEQVGHEGDGLGICLQISVVQKFERIFCSEICTRAKKSILAGQIIQSMLIDSPLIRPYFIPVNKFLWKDLKFIPQKFTKFYGVRKISMYLNKQYHILRSKWCYCIIMDEW